MCQKLFLKPGQRAAFLVVRLTFLYAVMFRCCYDWNLGFFIMSWVFWTYSQCLVSLIVTLNMNISILQRCTQYLFKLFHYTITRLFVICFDFVYIVTDYRKSQGLYCLHLYMDGFSQHLRLKQIASQWNNYQYSVTLLRNFHHVLILKG